MAIGHTGILARVGPLLRTGLVRACPVPAWSLKGKTSATHDKQGTWRFFGLPTRDARGTAGRGLASWTGDARPGLWPEAG